MNVRYKMSPKRYFRQVIVIIFMWLVCVAFCIFYIRSFVLAVVAFSVILIGLYSLYSNLRKKDQIYLEITDEGIEFSHLSDYGVQSYDCDDIEKLEYRSGAIRLIALIAGKKVHRTFNVMSLENRQKMLEDLSAFREKCPRLSPKARWII